MLPSGSLDVLPSSNTLSVGKAIIWSGPALEIGGLLFLEAHPSQEYSFLQEIKQVHPDIIIATEYVTIFFTILWFNSYLFKTKTGVVNGYAY